MKTTYLYRCFDREGELLYVGITDNVERRKKEHAVEKFWWGDVVRVTSMAFQTREQALWAEWAVINTCNPLHNSSRSVPKPCRCIVLPSDLRKQLPIKSMIAAIEEMQRNQAAYDALEKQMDELFLEAGIGPRPRHPDNNAEILALLRRIR